MLRYGGGGGVMLSGTSRRVCQKKEDGTGHWIDHNYGSIQRRQSVTRVVVPGRVRVSRGAKTNRPHNNFVLPLKKKNTNNVYFVDQDKKKTHITGKKRGAGKQSGEQRNALYYWWGGHLPAHLQYSSTYTYAR